MRFFRFNLPVMAKTKPKADKNPKTKSIPSLSKIRNKDTPNINNTIPKILTLFIIHFFGKLTKVLKI